MTIFGTKNSVLPGVSFYPVIEKGLTEMGPFENQLYADTSYIIHAVSEALKHQKEFDIINSHMYPEFLPLLAESDFRVPFVTTIHAEITQHMRTAMTDTKRNSHIVVLSNAAKAALGLDVTVIHNGIDSHFFTPDETKEKDHLIFIGRMSKAKDASGKFLDPKGVQDAISVAEKTGQKLKIIGNVEDKDFFEKLVKPHLSDRIEFVGKVSSEQSVSREEVKVLLQGAKALLFPIHWEEPCPLSVIESQSCGTPVIAYGRGSLSELIVDGKTGFVVGPASGVEGLVEALAKIDSIKRDNCRQHVLENFTVEKMVENYEKLFQSLIK